MMLMFAYFNLVLFLISFSAALGLTQAAKQSSRLDHTSNLLSTLNRNKPIVYTIAGSDSGGGAGIQADLHAMRSFHCHGCSAITCLTAQNSVAVTNVHVPPAAFLQAQLDALLSDLPPVAIKIGMLGTAELAEQVGDFLKTIKVKQQTSRQQQHHHNVWIVLDPVMISTSGARLIQEDAQQAMIDHVFPYTDLLTPNKFEAEALLGQKIESLQDIEQAARDLLALGVSAVLIKGGHTSSSSSNNNNIASNGDDNIWAQDYFLSAQDLPEEPRLCDGPCGVWIRSPRYDTEHTHGTGCTLSSSIASALALGEQERNLSDGDGRRGAMSSIFTVDACCLGKAYVTAGIHQGIQLGQGPGPVAHTEFPSSAQYYPSIVSDPTTTTSDNEAPFLPMKAFGGRGDAATDDRAELGRILPIVDSVEWVERICQAGGGVIDLQLRVKNENDPARILEQVRKAQSLCEKAGVRLWINDHWQAAVEAGCFGVHIGQEDLYKCVQAGGLKILREKNVALGISTHSFGELSAALAVKPSYVSLGPVFATASKKVKFDPQGLAIVKKWRELIPEDVPLVCIGGISDEATARDVRDAGADCVAVIGAVTEAPDVQVAVSGLNEAMTTL